MKKLFVIATAAVALAVAATPAQAGVVDINLNRTNVGQMQNGNVTQRALSVAAAIGSTGSNVDISSTAVSAAQLATTDIDVGQGASMLDVNALSTSTSQTVNGAVNQASASLAGSGNLGAGSSIGSTAANIGQSATVNIHVRQ